ncbi:hypothetical protein ACLB2K_016048 [Fragaria x ananassa]
MVRLVQEALGVPIIDAHDEHNGENSTEPSLGPNEPTKAFLKLLEGANLPLYPGSKKHTALSFIVRLLQAKVLHGWSDNFLKTLLEILEEAMSEGVQVPKLYYEAQKMVEDLGFTYMIIDACLNSCMLFRGWSTKGDYACPPCNSETGYQRLYFGKKGSYMCIRHWLEDDHEYRSDPMAFDGITEYRLELRSLSGVELLAQLKSDGVLT